ncbi:MOSC domain-containing protein [Lentzea sp. NBRC 102530]|uniref:MOSC domain-containing protein n=1 Tax=Lentzea sp. NBRC 102530 TaxID=3032201 RepID=UPI0024A4DF65|nr:MOSC domain-containing protein [Lentzea sp. NBRC 102530]GLY49429.1 sulfurase [Lentzea sp. NBRC 102530]
MARLLSLNVGLPKDVSWHGRTVHTGIFKQPVDGPRMVRRLNIDGDGQGDLGGHGGENRAVLVYQRESYEHWRSELGRTFEHGQFGENFTVEGLADTEVHVGDRFRIGGAEFEVTQPRVTCYRVGMRLDEPRMPSLMVAHGRPGFYLRVITEGEVRAGDEIVRTRVGRHALSVAAIDALLYLPGKDRESLLKAVDIPALSPGWQGSFRDLLAPPEPVGRVGFRSVRVEAVVPEGPSITSFHLAGDGLPRALPGQYLTVRVPGGVRSYSLSADSYRISVKRDGVVSSWLHDNVKPGDELEVAAPRGEFVLEPGDEPVVLLSAGVGITPVLAMLHALKGTDREVWWVHTTRSADQAFAEEVRELGPTRTVVRFSERGRLTQRDLVDLPIGASAYLCGPNAFMDDMREALVGLGFDPARIHTELFGARTAINPGLTGVTTVAPHQPARPGTGPQITFARNGLTAAVRDDESVLDLAEACDVPTRWSCRTGVCHTCVTPVLSGTFTNDPEPLEPPAPGHALICCARPETDLVLDL